MNLNVIEQAKNVLAIDQLEKVIATEKAIKELQQVQDEYKQLIKKEMEKRGLLGIKDEDSGLFINYIQARTNVEKFNTKAFREQYPDLYDEFVTLDGKRASYITIKF